MDTLDLLRRLARRWKVLVTCLVVCTAVSLGLALIQTPRYQSTVQLFVAAQGLSADDLSAAYQGGEFTTARVQSYVDLVKSPEVTAPVVSQLRLNMTPAQLARELTATAPVNTVLVNISVTDNSAGRAHLIGDAVARQFISVINRLEASASGRTPVKVSISSPATLPRAPASPRKVLNVLLGLIVGLVVGVGAAQVRDRLDDSVKSEDELEPTYGLPLLASIPSDSTAPAGISSLFSSEGYHRLEALRLLRTALRYLDVDHPPRCILVTSALPEEGKTTVASSLGVVLADGGNDVIVIEGDLRNPRLREYMGIPQADQGLAQAVADGRPVTEMLYEMTTPQASNGRLRVLPAGLQVPNPSELLGSDRMRQLMAQIRDDCDVVIIDAPPLLAVADATVLAVLSDGVLLIVEPGRTPHAALRRSIDSLKRIYAPILGFAANKTSPPKSGYYGYGHKYASSPPSRPEIGTQPQISGSGWRADVKVSG